MMAIAFRWFFACFSGLLLVGPVPADSSPVEKHGCEECHRFSQDDPQKSSPGPDLFYAGDKFQEKWLVNFLIKPVVIRKAGYPDDPGFLLGKPELTRPHPSLPDEEARKTAQYLGTLRLSGLAAEKVGPEPLSKGKRVKVKILFERNYSCIACHEGVNLAGKARGGISGPSLAGAGNRLQPDWVYHWLKSPEKFLEKSRMPRYNLDEEALIRLTKYIMSLKLEGLP